MADQVDEAAGRLYGLPLEEFTRERDATAKELRKAKERDAAATIAKLPKPSQAAWAANQLVREHNDLMEDLLAAVDALREAQDVALAGKGSGDLRQAAADQRRAVDALVAAAKDLRPAGRRPTEATLDRLRATLHAAATDDNVREALEAGRLVADAEGGGAWGVTGLAAGEAAEQPKAKRPAAKPRRTKRPAGESEEEREAREAEERERAERVAAERERRQRLEAELREARAERRARDRELARAEREADRAARRVEDAVAALEDARELAAEAKQELETAREQAEESRDQVARLEEQLD
jgi:hypothetical protein